MMSGQSGGRIRLSKLNDQLTCKLCRGYFIDATTIIECLHSFCRSCIVKYLETTKYCPICEVQVHKSKPLLNIRPDHTLQDIVYKLVPGCYQNEMRCRREFYEMHPEAQLSSMSPEARGEPIESHIYSPDESLSLSLEYYNPNINDGAVIPMDDSKESSAMIALTTTAALTLTSTPTNITAAITANTTTTNALMTSSTSTMTAVTGKFLPRRYLRCPAAVTVFHLQKLIRAKYGLSDAHRVDVMYKEESLCGNYTLMDVMYIYHWRRKVPLHLSYRIFESSPKRLKLSDDNPHFKESLTNAGISHMEPKDENSKREWKEVQLKISETGVMSVTGITSPESKKALAPETLEDDQRRLDESVAAVAMTDKKSTSNIKESVSSPTPELNTKNHGEQRQQQQTQRSSEKSSDNQTDSRKSINTKTPVEVKQVTTNNNNNSNSNNFNSTNESTSKIDTREKYISTTGNEMKNYQLPSGSGSKIDALSVKLQFQPKVGQVNNTYSKKTPKDKTMLEKVLKKSDNRSLFKDRQIELKNFTDKNRGICHTAAVCAGSKSSTNFQSKVTTIGQSQCTISSTSADLPGTNTITSTYSTISTPSVSISITSQKNSSPDRNKELTVTSHVLSGNLHKCRKGLGENTESSNQRSISNQITNTPSPSGGGSGKTSFTRQNNNSSLNSESLANIGLNVSTAFSGLGSSSGSSSTFPYTVQDLVNNAILKSPSKNLGNNCGQKQNVPGNVNVSSANHQITTPSSLQFNIQTPSMSVYSIPNTAKNNTSANSNTNNNSIKGNSKVNLEITTVYSVPPCPDAIPISMMKPTIRKTEIAAKVTNINDICAKMGTSGSKINDICAKIGESSKEKNKTDARLRPEIPDLLKITKKTMPSAGTNDNTTIKHIPNIPNVPIYTPTNNASSSDSRSIYMNKDTSKIMSMTTAIPITVATVTTSTTTITPITTVNNQPATATATTTTNSISTSISSLTNTSIAATMESISTSGSTVSSSSSSSAAAAASSSSITSSGTMTTITPSTSSFHQTTGRGNSMKRSQSQSVGYKTLRVSPKPWNPTLSKNNYVAAKNQAKEQQSQMQPSSLMSELSGVDGNNGGKNSIASKPAKIFKMRNMPRYLGNPASGVKPMYGLNNDGKDNKDQSMTSTAQLVSSKNSGVTSGLSMTKIDPKTLSPIISTNTNSPIVSPPPYSPNARSYQNTPFSRSGNSPLSPRNSPVNMLSTNPFIPSPTPNTNPRLIYSHFLPFPDGSRFANPLIRSSIGIPPPSAFHSSLPPSINKLYQRSSYMPQTTCATYVQQQGLTTQPPTVQRIPPSTHSSSLSTSTSTASSSPKSPKTTVTSSTFNLAKTETQTSIPTSLDANNAHAIKNQTEQDSNAFNLCKLTSNPVNSQTNFASDLSKSSTCGNNDGENKHDNDNESGGKSESVNKNDETKHDDELKKNTIVKEKNKLDDEMRINSEVKEQKIDHKDKLVEKEIKKIKKTKKKDKIILKEINIKRQLRDSHCIVNADIKNLLSKNTGNELQIIRENTDNSTSNPIIDQQSSITKEISNTNMQNSNITDTKDTVTNQQQHQTTLIDNKSTSEHKDITSESKNSSSTDDGIFSKITDDKNQDDSETAGHEELKKNEKHIQSKISEIQTNKAET